ncbi:MAG TPA: class A beta-lactamase-related serine hydrolase [Verrucomicrobia bacterium]|nr:class A beta-lactamase-related serine hydrolase [Verrucomicrobiota bacterium]
MKFFCPLFLLLCAASAATLPEAVDTAMREEMKQQELVGLAVGVIQNGRIEYLKGYGWADREKQTPVTRRTLFRWASISKSLTGVTALQLWEKGKLDLEADVLRYVPEFPAKPAPIRIRHLLCHQGGIVHYSNGPVVVTVRAYEKPNPFENVLLALDTFKHSPLVNAPGEKYAYTTHGFILLSAVVERAGRQKFAHQVRDRIAKPLGMTTLQPDYQWVRIPNRAVGYRKQDGKVVVSTDTDVSWKLGGGGFISNIDDLAKFAAGLMNHRLVEPTTRAKMWTQQKTNDGQITTYGLGFSFKKYHEGEVHKWKADGKGVLLVGHSGAQEKTRTYMILWPVKKMAVVVMTNSQHANIGKVTGRLLSILWPPEPLR